MSHRRLHRSLGWTAVAVLATLIILDRSSQQTFGAPTKKKSAAKRSMTTKAPASKPTTTKSSSAKPIGVELTRSYQIRKEEGGANLSHIPAVVFTPDGKRLITATAEGEVIAWDAASRKMLKRFRCSQKPSDGVSLDARGSRLAWVQQEGGVIILDMDSGKVLAKDNSLKAKWAALSPDGKLLAVTQDSKIEMRQSASLKPLFTIADHQAEVTNLAWSRDGKALASTAKDGRLIVTDLASRKATYTVKKDQPLYAASFSPAGNRIAFGGQDRQLYQRDLASGKEEVISQNQPYWITCVGYSPEGDVITIGDESCDVWTYEVPTKKLLQHTKHHVECWLNSVAWAPDNETFLLGCRPNSHAGKPTQYAVLNYQEAAQSPEARAVQRQIEDLRNKGAKELQSRKELRELTDKMESLFRKRQTRLATVLKQQGMSEEQAKKIAVAPGKQVIARSLFPGADVDGQVIANAPVQQMAGGFAGGGLGASGGYGGAGGAGLGAPGAFPQVEGLDSVIAFDPQNTLTLAENGQAVGMHVNDDELKKLDAEIAKLKKEMASKPGVKQLLAKLEGLQKEHRKRVQTQAAALGGSFNINQWKVNRAK